MPTFLLARLQSLFTVDSLRAALPTAMLTEPFVLYGEGFGARIQKGGGNYIRDGVDFILFDVLAGMFLERPNVEDIGAKLNLRVVPVVGEGTLLDAVTMARTGFVSTFASTSAFMAEGLVMRPATELRNRRGHRIISKIKQRDFVR